MIRIVVCLVAKLFQLQFLQFFSNKGPPAERQLRVRGIYRGRIRGFTATRVKDRV